MKRPAVLLCGQAANVHLSDADRAELRRCTRLWSGNATLFEALETTAVTFDEVARFLGCEATPEAIAHAWVEAPPETRERFARTLGAPGFATEGAT